MTKYWFGFKQTLPAPAGGVVLCGPYPTWEDASAKREAAKAPDCSVSPPFASDTREEALEKARSIT